ncbi:MAG: hypothetical protein ACOYMP_08715 [Nodosilinea sp.]
MGSSIFLLLFLLGILLAILGALIGIVDAFNVSPGWGLLSLFIPFALLFFCIKFWDRRRWARNSLVLGLLGLLAMVISLPFLQELTMPLIQKWVGSEPTVTAEPSGTPTSMPVAESQNQVFAKPFVPAAPGFSAIARANLIQSTDPDARRRLVNSNRLDPYATVPIPPPPVANQGKSGSPSEVAITKPAAPVLPSPTSPPATSGGAKQPSIANNSGSTTGATVTPQPAPLSENFKVTGVINLGGNSYAIVESADLGTPSYVKVGQRLANGQVLVKRIEMYGGSPLVIFEENGKEFPRPVG